jgi:hypothetical protein
MYMKKFAVNPPCTRPPLAAGQRANPTSIKHGEEFPKEWAKRQAKLRKTTTEAVRKFNEDTQAAAAAEASDSKTAPKKAMQKKPALKLKPSSSMPSWPSSLTEKPSVQIPQATSSRAAPTTSIAAKSSSNFFKDCANPLSCFKIFNCCHKVLNTCAPCKLSTDCRFFHCYWSICKFLSSTTVLKRSNLTEGQNHCWT